MPPTVFTFGLELERFWPLAVLVILGFAGLNWSSLVNAVVPEPYLDEVFHVGQAQAYLRGRWDVWDPKLTTPPGLYLASWAVLRPILALDLRNTLPDDFMSAPSLRLINMFGSPVLGLLVGSLLELNIEVHDRQCREVHGSNIQCTSCRTWSYWELLHTNLNISLFPPLFFFYGLFYTDVLSAVSVLFAYRCHLQRQDSSIVAVAGLLSLLFRQTNIFWVFVFLGGLTLCRTIRENRPEIDFSSQPTFYDVVERSWQHASAYDPLISQAYFEDYIKAGISYVIATLSNPIESLLFLTPYFTILTSFLQFIVWNGGVVLGDKENHVPSIHFAQMMYIWPYFAFFSWPIVYRQCLPETLRPFSYPASFPRKAVICTTMAVMLVVVRYNTIVHPFTLADNRHYMFYIFRILLRHWLIKYLAVPIYVGCAWVTLAALGGIPPSRPATQQENSRKAGRRKKDVPAGPQREQMKQVSGHRASFVLIWLLATALSIVTTPLVEPRYLIVPWLIWRLHIASPRPELDYVALFQEPDSMGTTDFEELKAVLYKWHDHRLWLETVWFLAINLVTAYVFLYRGFEWPQEPGKVQRFMW